MTMTDTPTIHVLMGRILDQLPAIGKSQRNEEQKFNFRGVDDVLNALNPLLGNHGVFYLPEVVERIDEKRSTRGGGVMHGVHLHVRFTFYGPAGDSVSASAWGEGTDMGDKATGKAMTAAQKSCLVQAFAICTAEQAAEDIDHHTPEETVSGPPLPAGWRDWDQHNNVKARLTAEAKALPEEVREEMKQWWHDEGLRWPLTVAEAKRYEERLALYAPMEEAS